MQVKPEVSFNRGESTVLIFDRNGLKYIWFYAATQTRRAAEVLNERIKELGYQYVFKARYKGNGVQVGRFSVDKAVNFNICRPDRSYLLERK